MAAGIIATLQGVVALLLAASAGLAEPAATPRPAPPPLEAYGRLPAIEQMVLSPDGRKIAFIGKVGDQRRLATLSAEGKPLFTSPLEDRKVRDVMWGGNDILLISATMTVNSFHYEDYRGEIGTLTTVNTANSSVKILFDRGENSKFYVNYVDGVRFIHNKWYGFIGYNGDLYKVDLNTGGEERVASSDSLGRYWLVDPAGAIAAQSTYDSKRGDWFLKARGRDLMHKSSLLHEYGLIGFSDTTDAVVVEDDTSAVPRLFEVSLAGDGAPRELWADFDWSHVLRSHDGLLLGALNTSRSDARFADPKLTARYQATVKAFPGYQFHLIDQTDDLMEMIAFTDGGDDAGTYWHVDIAKGSARVLATAYPDIKPKQVGPTRRFDYTAADGLALDGVLTLPPGREAKGLPLVVMPHGGPIGLEDKVGFDWWAQAFASRGYAVFQPNFRGSGGRGLEFERKGYGEWGRRMLSDMADGVAALVKSGLVDQKRACIVGSSYGGYAALAGVTLQHDLYRCAVAVSPVTDVAAYFNRSRLRSGVLNAGARAFRASLGVDDPSAPKLDRISPVNFAAGASAPILIVHGTDDTVVPMEQSKAMLKALREAGKAVEFVELKEEDHWLSRSDSRVAMLKASVEFVQRQNPAD